MEKKETLTICIPTYNRSKYIKKQLSFFQKQIENNAKLVEVISLIVADNASTDNTAEILSKYKNEFDFFDYVINISNLGLVGNIINLQILSKTEYVWFVSDDDDLEDGVIEEVLRIIESYNHPEFIFLNYLFNGERGFTGKSGYRVDSKDAAIEIFQEAYGSLVFMTSCVYKRQHLVDLSENKMYKWLSAPMLYSFFSCTKGPVYLCKDSWVNFNPNNASYNGFKKLLKLKFEEYISILEYLPELGYSKKNVFKTIQVFFTNQSHAHFLYNFISTLKSIRLYKYYKVETFLKIPSKIIIYLRK